jgi:hypothetical protein
MLQEYDVNVIRKGWFKVWAESEAEAQAQVDEMDGYDLEKAVERWDDCEVDYLM